MTSLDKDAVTVKALGRQAQSARVSAPSYGISKVGRDARSKVFITERHIKSGMLGRESPKTNSIELPSTLSGSVSKFGTSTRGNLPGTKVDDAGDMPTNDALQAVVDSQPFKYKKSAEALIGTEPKGQLKQAELLKAHSAAFFGRNSPGPAAIGDDYGPKYEMTKPNLAPARTFGKKLTTPNWMQTSDLPEEVGPGRYPMKDRSIGPQHLTQRRNQSVHAFPLGPKFEKTRNADAVSSLDAARSCFGKQPLGKNRSEPTINFNCDSRATRDKSMLCRTKQDLGPQAVMPKFRMSMPVLPAEKVVMKSGFG